eukprot:sb/3467463/
MPLISKNVTVSTLEELQSMESVAESSRNFTSKPPKDITSHCLYVCQAEYSAIPFDTSLHWIGTAGATTCHILAIYDSQSVALGHIDSETVVSDTITNMEELLNADDGVRHVCVVGGVIEAKGHSLPISENIFDTLSSRSERYIIDVWCTLDHNSYVHSDGKMKARVTDAVFDVQKKELIPAKFQSRGPELPLRSTRYYKTGVYFNPYNLTTGTMTFPYFEFSNNPGMMKAVNLPDDIILTHCSTSPDCEPDFFSQDMRDLFLFQATQTSEKVFGREKRPIVYILNSEGQWQRSELHR